MTDKQIKPCPCCGSPAKFEYKDWNEETETGDDGTGWIKCTNYECRIQTQLDIPEDAAEIWNKRAHDLEKELRAILDIKQGNKEIAVFFDPNYKWQIELGNPSQHVRLGEVGAEIEVDGKTLIECINKIKNKLGTT